MNCPCNEHTIEKAAHFIYFYLHNAALILVWGEIEKSFKVDQKESVLPPASPTMTMSKCHWCLPPQLFRVIDCYFFCCWSLLTASFSLWSWADILWASSVTHSGQWWVRAVERWRTIGRGSTGRLCVSQQRRRTAFKIPFFTQLRTVVCAHDRERGRERERGGGGALVRARVCVCAYRIGVGDVHLCHVV